MDADSNAGDSDAGSEPIEEIFEEQSGPGATDVTPLRLIPPPQFCLNLYFHLLIHVADAPYIPGHCIADALSVPAAG